MLNEEMESLLVMLSSEMMVMRYLMMGEAVLVLKNRALAVRRILIVCRRLLAVWNEEMG